MSELEELAQFLSKHQRLDVKAVAVQHILGMTGNKEGIAAISKVPVVSTRLLELLSDSSHGIAKDACHALINLSSDPATAKTLLQSNQMTCLVKALYDKIHNEDSKIADAATMVLSNLTRDIVGCSLVWEKFKEHSIQIERVVFIMCQEGYNKHGANLRYLAPILCNLCQIPEVRQQILDRNQCIIQRLLPFTEYKGSTLKKGGVIGCLRNCCFEHEHHSWLLGEDVDLLPRLLLPLAGPTPESLSDEEMDKLPVDLQYLDEDKEIEQDPDIRKMLLEALTQLCATKFGREYLREKNAYIILRELHKQEKDREVLLAAENIVDILIKKEEEIQLDNYKELEVPPDMHATFANMDKLYLEDKA